MKSHLTIAVSLLFSSAAMSQDRSPAPRACWLELSAAPMPGAMGGAGIEDMKVWNSTVSAVLVHHPKGDVLIDTGFGPDAEVQMGELPPAAKAFGLQVVAGAKNRVPITEGLRVVGEQPAQVARIIVTHAHYDHLGGATTLAAPIFVSGAEQRWMAAQAAHPTITPPSLVAAVKTRLRTVYYRSGPFLGFEQSEDFYGDGSIVAVPLPGHTPGSQGVIVTTGGHRLFLIGDTTDTLEAADRGLPKSPVIRAATDSEPDLADAQAKRVSVFHRDHPEIALIPAHDRNAYAAVFGKPSSCIGSGRSAAVN